MVIYILLPASIECYELWSLRYTWDDLATQIKQAKQPRLFVLVGNKATPQTMHVWGASQWKTRQITNMFKKKQVLLHLPSEQQKAEVGQAFDPPHPLPHANNV